jgi:Glycosyl transferase family 11
MVIIKVNGGLGNQLFQFAMGLAIEETLGFQVKYDLSEYKFVSSRKFDLDKFVGNLKIATVGEIERNNNVLQKIKFQIFKCLGFPFGLNGLKYYLERNFQYDEKVFDLADDIYLSGYWQSEKYFINHRIKILNRIKISDSDSPLNMSYLRQIRTSNSVSIHVRRGDYISNSQTNSIYASCDLGYYEKAIQFLSSQLEDLTFFVFSDDMEWVTTNFSKFDRMIFVNVNLEDTAFEDLKLMSNCKHNIIANSTFSWWAAWLNQNSNKIVIAPKVWYKNMYSNNHEIVPKKWLKF